MTGLEPDTDEILEICCILTSGDLRVMDEAGFHAVIHWPRERLDQMDAWCTSTHARSGLTAAVLASTVTPEQAAAGLHDYVTRFIPEPGRALLAGNSVHCDREFLRRGPYGRTVRHLHHRILDVSSIKEAARRWCAPGTMARAPAKQGRHKARDDILESIEEARYYRDVIFGLTRRQPAR